MGGQDEVKETPQQRAMVEHAQQQLTDYKARWLPLQQNMAKQIQSLAAPGSAARERAAGRSAVETDVKFNQARGALEHALTNAGSGPGSAKFKLGVTGMAADQAASKGLGMAASDQAIDDAYTQGLSALTAIGRGEKASALQGEVNLASMSGRAAAQDASLALQENIGQAQTAGQVVGFGLGMAGRNNAGTQSADVAANQAAWAPQYRQDFGVQLP